MDCVALLEEARSAGLEVRADGGKLTIKGPRKAEPLAKNLLAHKASVLELLRRDHNSLRPTTEGTQLQTLASHYLPSVPAEGLPGPTAHCDACRRKVRLIHDPDWLKFACGHVGYARRGDPASEAPQARQVDRRSATEDQEIVERLRSWLSDGTLTAISEPLEYRPGHTVIPGRLADCTKVWLSDFERGGKWRDCAAGHLHDIAVAVEWMLGSDQARGSVGSGPGTPIEQPVQGSRAETIRCLEMLQDELANWLVAEEERLTALPRDSPGWDRDAQRWKGKLKEYETAGSLLHRLGRG